MANASSVLKDLGQGGYDPGTFLYNKLFGSPFGGSKKKQGPLASFGAPAPVGLGFDYASPTRSKGFPPELLPAFGQAAGYVGQGSTMAAEALRRSANETFRSRAEGIVGGRSEERRRLGFESGATGYSPELLRRMSFAQDAGDQASISEAYGGAMSGFEDAFAELLKGTGTELANLKTSELGMLMQAYLNYKGRVGARQGGKGDLLGSAAGLGASLFGSGGVFGGAAGGGAAAGGGSAAGLALSDRRLKHSIVCVGESEGVRMYEFEYYNSPGRYRGVIADEVAHIPGAVGYGERGYAHVRYPVAGIEFTRMS